MDKKRAADTICGAFTVRQRAEPAPGGNRPRRSATAKILAPVFGHGTTRPVAGRRDGRDATDTATTRVDRRGLPCFVGSAPRAEVRLLRHEREYHVGDLFVGRVRDKTRLDWWTSASPLDTSRPCPASIKQRTRRRPGGHAALRVPGVFIIAAGAPRRRRGCGLRAAWRGGGSDRLPWDSDAIRRGRAGGEERCGDAYGVLAALSHDLVGPAGDARPLGDFLADARALAHNAAGLRAPARPPADPRRLFFKTPPLRRPASSKRRKAPAAMGRVVFEEEEELPPRLVAPKRRSAPAPMDESSSEEEDEAPQRPPPRRRAVPMDAATRRRRRAAPRAGARRAQARRSAQGARAQEPQAGAAGERRNKIQRDAPRGWRAADSSLETDG